MLQDLSFTFRGTIRGSHDNNTVLKQILKELLENHGISNISDLKLERQYTKMYRYCQTPLNVSIIKKTIPQQVCSNTERLPETHQSTEDKPPH